MADPILSIAYQDTAIRDRLQRLQRKLGDLTPVMKNIGQEILFSIDERYEKEEDFEGKPLIPNSPRTRAMKRAMGRIDKVRQSTGRERASVTYRADKDSVTVGTNVEYTRKNELGIGVPKRQIFGISDRDKESIITLLDEFLLEQ